MSETLVFSPTEFVSALNQTLDYAYNPVVIEGEVASFKTSQGKWAFFDLKDEESSVGCFIPLWQIRMPIEDGMKIRVKGVPKVTKWGKFSVTVKAMRPAGEGDLKRAFELLKKKLAAEGLFDTAKKRPLPENLHTIGVISSTESAGYSDFVKILNSRWGGYQLLIAHTQVQGEVAPDQIIRALRYLNERGEAQLIVIIRGGGSADDLSCFNDEKLVRAIAASKIPVLTGIGHERDTSLADLAADLRASTPTNAAEMISPDKNEAKKRVKDQVLGLETLIYGQISHTRMRAASVGRLDEFLMGKISAVGARVPDTGALGNFLRRRIAETRGRIPDMGRLKNRVMTEIEQKRLKIPDCSRLRGQVLREIEARKRETRDGSSRLKKDLANKISSLIAENASQLKIIASLNPEKVLKQGYAILAGNLSPGNVVKITTFASEAEAEIKSVKERN